MTIYGYKKLESKLEDLKKVQRPQIVIEIDIARSHGDLKENAEYHAAKEKQSFIEARISDYSDVISRAQIIDPSSYAHKKVLFGSTVKLQDLTTDNTKEYTIVGAIESNLEKGLISFNSPLAKGLIGKKKGDEIILKLPGGEFEFEILDVYFKEIVF